MARLQIPFTYRFLFTTGDVVLRAELILSLRTNKGTHEEVTFLVDSGTEMTTMAAGRAHQLDLPLPQRPVAGLKMTGQEVRAGLIRAQVVGMDATEYVFPCYFLGDPGSPQGIPTRNLLGLSGVIDKIRITFEGTPSATAPYGHLVVEKR